MKRFLLCLAVLPVLTGCGVRTAASVNLYLPRSAQATITIDHTSLHGDGVSQGKTVTADTSASLTKP